MRIWYLIMFFLTASFCAVHCAEQPSRVETFSKLKQGDTLIVRYHTSGCFHDATHELTFHHASDLTVSIRQLAGYVASSGTIQTNSVELGTLKLSKTDVAGLDKLLKFYHSKHDNICTTVDHISFTQQRDGKTVATEEIEDGSCQTDEMKDITRFAELIARLNPQK